MFQLDAPQPKPKLNPARGCSKCNCISTGGIFEDQSRGLHQNRLPGRQIADEYVARGVQQQKSGRLRRREAIHEHADRIVRFLIVAGLRGVPDIGGEPIVGDVAGGEHEQMLAHVHFFAGLQRKRDHFAGRVARESDMAGSLRLHHDERQPREHALPSGSKRHGGDVQLRILPQQNVVREVDAVGSRQVDVGDGNVEAFNLAERIAELELGHVFAAGQFAPNRIRCGYWELSLSRRNAGSSIDRRRFQRRTRDKSMDRRRVHVRRGRARRRLDGLRMLTGAAGSPVAAACAGGRIHGAAARGAEVGSVWNLGYRNWYKTWSGYSVW